MYVPRGRRSQTTPPTAPATNSNSEPVSKTQVLEKESVNVISLPNSTIEISQNSDFAETNFQEAVIEAKIEPVPEPVDGIKQESPKQPINSQSVVASSWLESPPLSPPATETIAIMTDTELHNEGGKIETALNSTNKDYNEEKEFQKASKV